MTNSKTKEIKVGDLVEWRSCHTIRSTVKEITQSKWNKKIMIYKLANDCEFQKHEIRRVE